METIKATQHFCWECGNDVHQLPGRRLKKFCCSECRTKWWNRQRRAERAASPRAEDAHVCQHCGTVFFAYGQNARKYCSHECYIAARFGDKNPADTSCRKPDGKDIECGSVTGHEPDGLPEVAPMEPVMIDISIYAGNPYAKKATTERIELDESFFVAAYPLLEAGIDKVLSAFGMDPAHFSAQEKTYIIGRLYRMENSPVKDTLPLDIDDCTVRIMAARISAMEELVEEKLRGIGARIREMTPPERKEICRMIHSLPKDPGGVFTTGHMLSLAGISRNSYYCYIGKDDYGLTVSARDAIAEEAVRRAFEYKGYKKGVRMVYMLIPRLTGRKIGMDRVRRIMREYGMDCGVRKANSSRQAAAKRLAEYGKPNLLKRMFRLHRPNEVRITDVTYLKYSDDLEAYGSALMDPVTGVLVAFVVSDHNDLELAKETLRRSDSHPCRDGGTFHSDQGSVYLSPEFQEEVKKLGFKQSMSKRGNCWDNASQESFFGHFKDECDYSGCKDLDELKAVIDGYSYYYNNERGLWDRKKMTPVQYEAYLLSLTDNEFAEYMAREEKKYNDMKAEAAKKAKERFNTLGV